jgi:hypothetical protein
MSSTVERTLTEIYDHAHQMVAEGTSDVKPIESDIVFLLNIEGWEAINIQIFYDHMMGFWRWCCDIKQV